jgi:hypothetical protein
MDWLEYEFGEREDADDFVRLGPDQRQDPR